MSSEDLVLSATELDELEAQKSDLVSQLKLLKWRPGVARSAISNIIKQLQDSAKDDAAQFGANLYYGKTPMANALKKMLFLNMSDAEIIAETADMFVLVDFALGRLIVPPIEKEDLSEYLISGAELFKREQRALLFSTVDAPMLYNLAKTAQPGALKTRLDAYHARNLALLEKVDGTIDALAKLPLLMFGEPAVDYFKRLRLSVAQNRGTSKAIGVVLRREPFQFAEAEVDDVDFKSIEEIDVAIDVYKRQGEIFLLNLRNDYGRNRGWLPARLTWSGDDRPPAAPSAPKSRRRPTQPRVPQASTEPEPEQPAEPEREAVVERPKVPYGLFEGGIHRNQLLLNEVFRKYVPYVNSAVYVNEEVLRLLVIAYQTAFQGRSLDDILTPLSGSDANGQNIYVQKVKTLLAQFDIDTREPLQRDAAVLSRFDSLLSSYVMFFDDTNTDEVTPYLDAKRNASELEVQKSFYPYVYDFVWRYWLQPFGPMTRKEERLRAVIKSRYLGSIAVEDKSLMSDYFAKMAVGTAEERFDTLTDFLVVVVKQYAQSGKFFGPPKGLPVDEQIEFTRDFEQAHEHARKVDDPSIPLKLAELYEILGTLSNIMYGDIALHEHLLKLSGRKSSPVSVYYTLEDGIFVGSDPVTAEQLKSRLFSFDPKALDLVVEPTTTTEGVDDDGPPMLTDYKSRNQLKFNTFYSNLKNEQ